MGAEGAFIDPLSGDFLFSTFGSNRGDRVIAVRGFPAAAVVPEPSSLLLLTLGAIVVTGYVWRCHQGTRNGDAARLSQYLLRPRFPSPGKAEG